MTRSAGLVVAFVVCVAMSGCTPNGAGGGSGGAGSPGAALPSLDLSASDASIAQVDLRPLPADASPPVLAVDAAVRIASANATGGPSRGPLLGVGRGRAAPDASSAPRTAWIVVFGAGGQVPLTGPSGGYAPILLQVIAVDDQTGAFIHGFIKSSG